MPRVFISYSHESEEHNRRVLQLANVLRVHGIDVELDRYHSRPTQGWPQWCEEQLRPENSDYVLMICTDRYLRSVQNQLGANEGKGVFWEGRIIYNYLYNDKRNTRFIPVLLSGSTPEDVPIVLRGDGQYRVEEFDLEDSGYRALYCSLTNQNFAAKPPLGPPVQIHTGNPLPQREVRSTFSPALKVASSRLFPSKTHAPDTLVGRESELAALDAAWAGEKRKQIVAIVAWGGVGKTSLVAHWAAKMLSAASHVGIERYFDWSFYTQGGSADVGASADIFVKEALEFFGDLDFASSTAGPWRKGERLAELVSSYRSLLVLDGLEVLQDLSGELRDEAVKALLRRLSSLSHGLCVVTTRHRVPELRTWPGTTTAEWTLGSLSTTAGAQLLTNLNVNGTEDERLQLSQDLRGHALTLTLVGKYLAEAHGGDIRRRDLVSLREADYDETRGHAFHVLRQYEELLRRSERFVELSILRLLGVFGGPATPDCIAALKQPSISGLTDSISAVTDAQWTIAIRRLVQLGLIEQYPWVPIEVLGYSQAHATLVLDASKRGDYDRLGDPKVHPRRDYEEQCMSVIDTHPLIREYFAKRLRDESHFALLAAHARLFQYLQSTVPYWPEGLSGLQPLYEATAHGCQAAEYEAALSVYINRIQRGTRQPHGFYSTRRLGAPSVNLAAIRSFFVHPWSEVESDLTSDDKSWLLSEAAGQLRLAGRLLEAHRPMRLSVEGYIAAGRWTEATHAAGGLAGTELVLGNIDLAIETAEQALHYDDIARDSEDTFYDPIYRCDFIAELAEALHHRGRKEEARKRFEKAETEQRHHEVNRRFLYTHRGFAYCELLLTDVERLAWNVFCGGESDLAGDRMAEGLSAIEAVRQRALQTFEWVAEDGWLADMALDRLTIGRTLLIEAILTDSDTTKELAVRNLDFAVRAVRESGHQYLVPLSLIARAWSLAAIGLISHTRADLDEAQQIAERGSMWLQVADIHLYRARLLS